jgi:hypothetical protein
MAQILLSLFLSIYYTGTHDTMKHSVYVPLLLFALLTQYTTADFLSSALPQPGTNPREQIQCYALPYGGLGFTTHILTYYTFIMLTLGRSPWRWKRLTHYRLDLTLAIAGLPFTVTPVVVTMLRCRSRWVFYLLAAWKLSLSLMICAATITTALIVKQGVNVFERNRGRYMNMHNMRHYSPSYPIDDDDSVGPKYKVSHVRTLLWMAVYGIGTIVGFVGLVGLVIEAWDEVTLLRHLTYGALALFIFLAVMGFAIGACCWPDRLPGSGIIAAFGTAALVFGFGAVIYSDWALAAVANNMVGSPDGNNIYVTILYWTYFAGKRLPMLSC